MLLRFDIGAAPAFTVSTGSVEPRYRREVLEDKVAAKSQTLELHRGPKAFVSPCCKAFPHSLSPQEDMAKSLLAQESDLRSSGFWEP